MALELQSSAAATASAARGSAVERPAFLRRRAGDGDRMFFTEQLALLLETGSNLYTALRALAGQTQNPAMVAVIESLAGDIAEGRPLSQALQKHPQLFSANYVNLIAASEHGGFMYKILYELKSSEEKRAELKRILAAALSYPAFLAVFSTAVVVFILVVVFPKFGDLFMKIYDELPLTTKALMSVSDALVNFGIYIAIALAGGLVALVRWIHGGGRETVDRLLMRVPFVRDILAELNLVQILRVLSLSLANGVAMIDALRACREVVRNAVFKTFIDQVERLVQEGGRIAVGFEQARFMPPLASSMIRTAEDSGSLTRVAGRLADYYEAELARRLKTLARVAEPIMLLVMGAVVGLLVSSLILPIFRLARAVS
jgi:type II secretory pathway component PulF